MAMAEPFERVEKVRPKPQQKRKEAVIVDPADTERKEFKPEAGGILLDCDSGDDHPGKKRKVAKCTSVAKCTKATAVAVATPCRIRQPSSSSGLQRVAAAYATPAAMPPK
eukprot:3751621-Lingulodinium_polyedra.AAC.1